MKKFLMFFCLAIFACIANGQALQVSLVDEFNDNESRGFCADTLIIYVESTCPYVRWYRPDFSEELISNELIVTENLHQGWWGIESQSCGINMFIHVYLSSPTSNALSPFDEPFIWKRCGETVTLGNPELTYLDFLWSTGETTPTIDVSEEGIYSVEVNDPCGPRTYSIEVRNNVELYRATVDLATNLNKTTWQVTTLQADYISEVKVYRDGLLVGTAPYEQGYYLDAIGSDNAARNYKIVGVSIEGEDCPIESYEKGTIHTTYYQDVNGNLNMTWNVPYVEEGAQGALTNFQICKYNPNNGSLTVVDQVNSSITDYTCGVNQFDGGYAVIDAVFDDGKGVEELAFSNLTTDILGVGENALNTFSIYPNPAQDRITVEGTGSLSITNTLGQIVLTQEIDGKTTIELPKGLYFAKMGNTVRKIVVE